MIIRPTILEDIDNIMGWVNDPIVLEKFANFKPVSKEDELKFLTDLLKSSNDKTFTIEENGEYLGQVSINKIYWAAMNGRLAIAIHPNARGRGVATKAVQLLIEKGFNEMKLHKLWMILKTDNLKGIALYESLGFKVEAILKDEYVNPVTGEYIDMVRLYKINPND
ncbi:MAG: Spermidine N(1)-acetyltransferase [uncultured marine phage]|uniref:Spermidine N(1)-acetyltransferase n=1 Tax=uncultured marine phage TaxID=707152 RepID=A0A8D9CBP1_9VIRU|nr:MAG: Spermidine N(1)-acetyltransferase [uncultured marine phage]